MPAHQLGHLEGYKWFTDWWNNTWKMGNPTQGKLHVNCVTACCVYSSPCNSLCKVPQLRTLRHIYSTISNINVRNYYMLSSKTHIVLWKSIYQTLWNIYANKPRLCNWFPGMQLVGRLLFSVSRSPRGHQINSTNNAIFTTLCICVGLQIQ